MTTHLSPEELEAFRRKTLSAQGVLAASRHLADCEECVARLRAQTGATTAPSLTGEDDEGHLGYEQIEAYVDGRLPPRARAAVDEHLSQCRHCAGDLDQVRTFAARMNVRPPASAGARTGWRERISGCFRVPQFAMAASAAAVVAVLAGSFVFIHYRAAPRVEQALAMRPVRSESGTLRPDDLPEVEMKDLSESERAVVLAAVHGELLPAGPAQAAVPDDAAIEQLRRQKPKAHLLLGSLYQQLGMWEEAAKEYHLALDANPGSKAAHKLWQNARAHVPAVR